MSPAQLPPTREGPAVRGSPAWDMKDPLSPNISAWAEGSTGEGRASAQRDAETLSLVGVSFACSGPRR